MEIKIIQFYEIFLYETVIITVINLVLGHYLLHYSHAVFYFIVKPLAIVPLPTNFPIYKYKRTLCI